MLAAVLLAATLGSAPAGAQVPVVAIVIDDLGYQREDGIRALELPGPVTYAILPHTPHGPGIARLAHALDKEVIVHLPMQANSRRRLGPGALTEALPRDQFIARVNAAIDSVPHARGVNNHMGSHLTSMARPMSWLMDVLAERSDLMFLDSRTTARTVAASVARAAGIRSTQRDVFLDNDLDPAAIRRQLAELVSTARAEGSAIAIGHPYPSTLRVLAQELPQLSARGVRLESLGHVIERRTPALMRVAQSSLSGQAATIRQTPSAPRTQVRTGAPASITGWNPSRP